ncbi:MAG TPA: hypothetical protein VH157_00815 [Bryobacteraceae bacterium]|jgi:hypothetical protein|nr:hypothetical protein [Bryobacteraceae bacterium]
MRKRLLVSFVCGAVGLATAVPLGDQLGLSTVQSLIAFSAGGLFVGYVLTIFLDVFTASTTTETEN